MLRWMETRRMLGSVRDEVKRLENLHHTMLSINEQLLRFLDAVAISAAPKCHGAEFSTPLNVALRRSEFSRNDTIRDTIRNSWISVSTSTLRPHPPKVPDSNAADSPVLSSSQNMRKTVEVESDEYKRKLESQRHMLREIEVHLAMRQTGSCFRARVRGQQVFRERIGNAKLCSGVLGGSVRIVVKEADVVYATVRLRHLWDA
jgi:hypothetical protein